MEEPEVKGGNMKNFSNAIKTAFLGAAMAVSSACATQRPLDDLIKYTIEDYNGVSRVAMESSDARISYHSYRKQGDLVCNLAAADKANDGWMFFEDKDCDDKVDMFVNSGDKYYVALRESDEKYFEESIDLLFTQLRNKAWRQ